MPYDDEDTSDEESEEEEGMEANATFATDDGFDAVVEEEEVVVTVNEVGELVVRASHVDDYVSRGYALRGMSLWEYTARVSKHRIGVNDPECDDPADSDDEDEVDMQRQTCVKPFSSLEEGNWTDIDAMLNDRQRKRPRFMF